MKNRLIIVSCCVVALLCAGLLAKNINDKYLYSESFWLATHGSFIKWEGVDLNYGDRIVYIVTQNGDCVSMQSVDCGYEGGVCAGKMSLKSIPDVVDHFNSLEDGFEVVKIEVSDRKNNIVYVERRRKSDGYIMYGYHFLNLGVVFFYHGPEEQYYNVYKAVLMRLVSDNSMAG